jgi:uncharacterized protein
MTLQRESRRRRRAGAVAVVTITFAAVGVLSALTIGPVHRQAAPTAEQGSPAPSGSIRRTDLSIRTVDGLILPATLRVPTSARGRVPGVVLVHGAGPGQRDQYRTEAEAFARRGIATLSYDKRAVGYSLVKRSYSTLANDVVAAADVLRNQPGIDPDHVGLWGISEGGWVAPLAASRDPDVAFLVVVGANGMAPLRQQIWAEAVKLQAAGIRGSLVDAASAQTYRFVDALGMFPEAFHDPEPVLQTLRLPVLAIWGALDRSTPPVESAAAFRRCLDQAGNQRYVLRTVDRAGHSLRTTDDGFREGTRLAPGYAELVGSWVTATVADHPRPASVTGTGHQHRRSAPVRPAAWWDGAAAHGLALGLMAAGFGGFGLVAAVRGAARLAGRSQRATGTPGAARVLAAAGSVTVVGTLLYLGQLAVVRGGSHLDPGFLLVGRPPAWLALQALALTTVTAGVALSVRLRSAPATGGERVRLVLLLLGAVAFVPWSLYWRLLMP